VGHAELGLKKMSWIVPPQVMSMVRNAPIGNPKEPVVFACMTRAAFSGVDGWHTGDRFQEKEGAKLITSGFTRSTEQGPFAEGMRIRYKPALRRL
jgi:hypothetical protein